MKALSTTAVAALLAVAATGASATTLSITTIQGLWQNDTPDAAVTGEGTSSIRWGVPQSGGAQSGYDFTAEPTTLLVDADTMFDLGTFTHINRPITGETLNTAEIAVSIIIDGLADPITSVFSFQHLESNNEANPCANPGADNSNGCADRVTATLNLEKSETFTIGGVEYVFNVTGFRVGGSQFTEFWTKENAENHAILQGTFTAVENINPIPLPAAGWMLIAGLGGMAAMRKRKATA